MQEAIVHLLSQSTLLDVMKNSLTIQTRKQQ